MDAISAFFTSLDPTLLPLGAIVTFVVISLLRGWLIPRRIYIDRITDKDAQIKSLAAERDDWKAAAERNAAAALDLRGQNRDLIDGSETTLRLMESLRNQIERSNPVPPTPPAGS